MYDVDVLKRYVPRVVMNRYLKCPEALEKAELSSFNATLVFFDISGFSAFASQLSALEGEGTSSSAESASGGPKQVVDGADVLPSRRRSVALNSDPNLAKIRMLAQSSTAGFGTEQLMSTLNQTLEPIINIIHAHEGDIIKFAGDAMIVAWETEQSLGTITHPGILTCHAIECALRALEKSSTPRSHTKEFKDMLGLHIGMGVSQVNGNHVGGIQNQWEYYVSGHACDQMNNAEADAKEGQLVISKECVAQIHACHEILDLSLECTELEGSGNYLVQSFRGTSPKLHYPPFVRATLPTELTHRLQSYVSGPVIHSLKSGGNGDETCIRQITVAFIGLDGILDIHDPLEQITKVHESFLAIQEAVMHAAGTIRQFLIDDKGAVAIAAIGLPPLFHEDNPLRGVKLAVRLREKGVKASIGLTTGKALCGSVGSSSRAEYAIVGDTIILAARFMGKAKCDEIICDEITRQHAMLRFEFDAGEDMKIKGKENQVIRAYRVLGEYSTSEQAQSLKLALKQNVGGKRTSSVILNEMELSRPLSMGSLLDEIDELREPFDTRHTTTNHPATDTSNHNNYGSKILLVEGGAGTGKSMLMKWVQNLSHITTVVGRTDSLEKSSDYYAWRDVLRVLLLAKPRDSSLDDGHLTEGMVSPHFCDQDDEVPKKLSVKGSPEAQQLRRQFSLEDDFRPTAVSPKGSVSPSKLAKAFRKNSGLGSNHEHHHAPGMSKSFRASVSLAPLSPTGGHYAKPKHLLVEWDIPSISSVLHASSSSHSSSSSKSQEPRPASGFKQLSLVASVKTSPVIHALLNARAIERVHVPLLNMILSIDLPETQMTLRMDPRKRRNELLCMISEIMREVCYKTNIIYAFDDGHFMDPKSIELLYYIACRIPSFRVLFNFRKLRNFSNDDFENLCFLTITTQYLLENLNPKAVSRLLSLQYGITRTNDQVMDFLDQHAKGNPGMIKKLMGQMLETGMISVDTDAGTVSIIKPLDEMHVKVPAHLHAKVMSIFDLLSVETKNVLRIASCCTEAAEKPMIEYVYDRIHPSTSSKTIQFTPVVISELKQCVHDSIIAYHPREHIIHFHDQNTRLTVYGNMIVSHRARIHQAIISWYRHDYPPGLTMRFEYYNLVGYHLLSTGQFELSCEYFSMAAEQALLTATPADSRVCLRHLAHALDEIHARAPAASQRSLLTAHQMNLEFFSAQLAIHTCAYADAISHLQYVLDSYPFLFDSKSSRFDTKVDTTVSKLRRHFRKTVTSATQAQAQAHYYQSKVMLKRLRKIERQREKLRRQLTNASKLYVLTHAQRRKKKIERGFNPQAHQHQHHQIQVPK